MKKLMNAEKIVFCFLLFVAAMLIARVTYANNFRYIFLLWNLFLAWIPFQLGITLSMQPTLNRWLKLLLLAGWLLFFPNALYIITDLIHLENQVDSVPVWYDAVLLFTSSITGLIMAFVSLYQVELFSRKSLKASHVNLIVTAALFLGSFGVYLGRFLRWNSWDVLANPGSLFIEIAVRFRNPVFHYRTWLITALLTCFFSLLYFSARQLPRLMKESVE